MNSRLYYTSKLCHTGNHAVAGLKTIYGSYFCERVEVPAGHTKKPRIRKPGAIIIELLCSFFQIQKYNFTFASSVAFSPGAIAFILNE